MSLTPSGHTIGTWDSGLFDAFRALPAGPGRRALASELIRINEPLIVQIVSQLQGTSPSKVRGRKTAASRMGGLQGFHDIPWEDAMQAGRMALGQALETFDPSKGKISFYFLMKARYLLQVLEAKEQHLARVPRGRETERASVALVGESTILDRMGGAGDPSLGGLAQLDGITPEDLERWQTTGEWPESIEEWQASKPKPMAPPAIDQFLDTLSFRKTDRESQVRMFMHWEHFAQEHDALASRGVLSDALYAHGVRPMRVRLSSGASPSNGFAGVCLQC